MENISVRYNFELISKAFAVAAREHKNQTRKGTVFPYIIHPMDVARILFKLEANTNQICAALLHDTIEDTTYSIKKLEEEFGDKIKDLVVFCSEEITTGKNEQNKKNWKKRKEKVINKAKLASNEELLILFADKLSNMRSFCKEYAIKKDQLWEKFNGSKEDQFWFNQSLYLIFKTKFQYQEQIIPFLNEYKEHINYLWPKLNNTN